MGMTKSSAESYSSSHGPDFYSIEEREFSRARFSEELLDALRDLRPLLERPEFSLLDLPKKTPRVKLRKPSILDSRLTEDHEFKPIIDARESIRQNLAKLDWDSAGNSTVEPEIIDLGKRFEFPAPTIFIKSESIFKRVLSSNSVKEAINSADPFEYQELICELLKHRGFDVLPTHKRKDGKGKDGGVDFIATKHDGTTTNCYFGQVKHNKTQSVDVMAVRELYGVVEANNVTGGLFVCSSTFSKDSHDFRETIPHRMTFADYKVVERWIQRIQQDLRRYPQP